jgi:hypothetical protein
MLRTLFPIVALVLSLTPLHAEVTYTLTPDFITPPPGKATIGDGHGEIRVDSAGLIYVSVQGQAEGGIQVYSPEGKYLRHLAGVPGSLHGFVIHKEEGGEFIYGAVLGEGRVLKMTLEGKTVLEIPKTAFPAEQSAAGLKLTNCDVAPNGDIYVVDGYGKDWIFVFDKEGKFKSVFGGQGEPLKLSNCHKIFIDTRYTPARVLACDRGNNRMLHLDLDGKLIGVVADKDLRRPSSASFHGDLMCVAEIAGRVSVFDKDGKQVASLGVNDAAGETNTPAMKPEQWRTGTVTSPHGITFDNAGNILETEWNSYGRVLRWTAK